MNNANGLPVNQVAPVSADSREAALLKTQVGAYGSQADKIDWSYYDTAYLLNTGPQQFNFFTTPLGQGGKRLDETNLTLSSQIPQGQFFRVHNIKFQYIASEPRLVEELQTLYDLLRTTTIQVKLSNKESVGQFTLGEMFGMAIMATLVTTETQLVPFPKYHGVFPLNHPIDLAGLTTFWVEMRHHVATSIYLNDDAIRCILNGELTRVS